MRHKEIDIVIGEVFLLMQLMLTSKDVENVEYKVRYLWFIFADLQE